MVLHEYLNISAERYPEKVALRCGDSRLTYRELLRTSNSLASFLLKRGLEREDRVVIFLENSPEAVISLFGALRAGGCYVMVNPKTPPERLAFIVQHCGAKFLIVSSKEQQWISSVSSSLTHPRCLIFTGRTAPHETGSDFESACRTPQSSLFPTMGDQDLATILYTSGSAGVQKGVTLTHRNIDTVVSSVSEYLGHTSDDIVLGLLQLSFGYGLLQVLVTFKTGGRIILEKGYGFPYDIINRIKEEHITGLAGVPTMFSLLLQLSSLEKEDLSSVRYLTNAAAALPPTFIPKLKRVFPFAKLYLMHGLTECLRTTYLPPEELDRRPTSVGRGMPNVELWIEDEHGQRLSDGRTGELVVRGANVMRGYWNAPEETARVLRPGRYPWERVLYTGDLFRMDRDGFLYFVSRKDDVIKSRGEKVSPLEVENIIYTLDEIAEVRVIGVPDDILGQAIKAEIVLKEGKTLSERDVLTACKKHLEDYKVPHVVDFLPSLPKTLGGKIKRSLS
jgi:amino acid adenylation domain-containing protein